MYVPVLAPHLRNVAYGWRAAAAYAEGKGVHLTPGMLQQVFASMMDDGGEVSTKAHAAGEGGMLQRVNHSKQPSEPLPHPTHAGTRNSEALPQEDSKLLYNWVTSMRQLASVTPSVGQANRLEHMGVAITMAAFRLGLFNGT